MGDHSCSCNIGGFLCWQYPDIGDQKKNKEFADNRIAGTFVFRGCDLFYRSRKVLPYTFFAAKYYISRLYDLPVLSA